MRTLTSGIPAVCLLSLLTGGWVFSHVSVSMAMVGEKLWAAQDSQRFSPWQQPLAGDASQVGVEWERRLDRSYVTQGFELSHDQRQLAFGSVVPANSATKTLASCVLQVLDLQSLKTTHQVKLDPSCTSGVREIAWSPDDRRLLYSFASKAMEATLAVVDLSNSRNLVLPIQVGSSSDVKLIWYRADSAAVFGRQPFVFSLENLRQSPFPRGPEREAISASRRPVVPHHPVLSFETGGSVFRPGLITAKNNNGLFARKLDSIREVGIYDDWTYTNDARYLIVRDWDAPRHSDLVLVRLKNIASRVSQFLVKFDEAFAATDPAEYSRLLAAVDQGHLLAWAYAPVTNPLNNRVVSGDEKREKGMLRYVGKQGNSWIFETMTDSLLRFPEAGDVVQRFDSPNTNFRKHGMWALLEPKR